MAKRDYYEVLEVTKTVTTDELKVSYRKLAMRYHPDRNPGDAEAEAKFKEATEAFEVLADPQKRAAYDRYGHEGLQGMGGGGGGGQQVQVDLSDLLGDLFGGFFGAQGGGRRSGPQPGRDVQVILDIDLAEAARGVTKKVTVQREDHCGTCNGTGAKPGTKVTSCKRCGGQGEVIVQQMFIRMRQPCRACNGSGEIVTDPCGTCRGAGNVVGRQEVEVKVTPGVDTGDRIRYTGQGDVGDPGAPRGNLEFAIRVKEHKFFQRDGQNLVCQWPITFAQAALGGPVEITTLVGEKVKYELPRGIQTHEVIRLSGHGMPPRRGGRTGDLLVQVVVDTPQSLTPEQEQLFRRLAELDKSHVGPPSKKSFFSKLKDLFGAEEK
ncbi:MAG: molecular chaperone DnaJ [Fimbriiglobus sp.]|jgi:molecular chaperone DnaJ|nr:molecular chaperone DnaJ [Fimbriiglobus sp.]